MYSCLQAALNLASARQRLNLPQSFCNSSTSLLSEAREERGMPEVFRDFTAYMESSVDYQETDVRTQKPPALLDILNTSLA